MRLIRRKEVRRLAGESAGRALLLQPSFFASAPLPFPTWQVGRDGGQGFASDARRSWVDTENQP